MGLLLAILLSAASPATCAAPHDPAHEIVHVEVAQSQGADFDAWLCAFGEGFYRSWPVAGPAGTTTRTAQISIVHNRGRRAWVYVKRSTGVAALDVQLQRALEGTQFPPYPAGYYDDQLRLELEVRYRTEDEPSACFATRVPSSLGDAFNLPADIQMIFDHYRNGWRDLCRGIEGHPSLETLLAEAETLGAISLDDGIDRFRFITLALPGMTMDVDEASVPDHAAFAEAAARLGTDDDRFFWPLYAELSPYDPAWIEVTGDYGGCPRFGEYDWVAGLETLRVLQDGVRGSKYRQLAQGLEGFFWTATVEWGTEDDPICTCGAKGAVLPDLERLAKAVTATSAPARRVAQLRTRIAEIKSGRLKVASEREGHCSGG